jgi:choline-phosphate cytidylyltransferase
MNQEERGESVRHCRWVDEVAYDRPWTLDEAFMKKHQIDYVAHDEELTLDANGNDAYEFLKRTGQ